MNETAFWSLLKEYNQLMRTGITGPNCIDPQICKGDCCSIKIDVPKILAKEYIRKGYANKEDFIRSDVFSFHLRFEENTGKCFFFDKMINGCSVHNSGMKPPQCWIYPTNFSNPENKEIRCKKVSGWKIIDPLKTERAETILEKLVAFCELEAKKELENINIRIGKKESIESLENLETLKILITSTAPSNLAGFKDGWDHFKILSAEGLSLQVKKLCLKLNDNCRFLPDNYLDCQKICNPVLNGLITLLHQNLYEYILING
ncbi:MAG: hypothetical protein EU521_01635, partial [Promethearchaeota archaeon]